MRLAWRIRILWPTISAVALYGTGIGCGSRSNLHSLEPEDPVARTQFRLSYLQGRIERGCRGAGQLPERLEEVLPGCAAASGTDLCRDAWGREFGYEHHGRAFTIRSAGPDGVLGNGDDLKVSGQADP